tara:strand:- start:275 stop:1180 length:906 start_codon:yes stop_codon:yes gene_type:complete
MIVSKCPLRISLVGGSTDLLEFVEKYEMGSVISFPVNLYTYIFLSYNMNDVYRINYSKTEEVNNPLDIKNDVAREVIKYFDLPPVTVAFNADIPTTGSGLASSSSYVISFVSAVNKLLNLNLSQYEMCKISLEIEHKFNPLTGYQDLYGCGIGDLKRLYFYKDRVDVKKLDSKVFDEFKMYLVNTDSTRNSNKILSSVDIDKSKKLLILVDELEKNILNKNKIYELVNDGWEKKKETSPFIMNNKILELDKKFSLDNSIKGVKLCGAGGGGYFLILSDDKINDDNFIEINIENNGVISKKF